MVNFVLFFLSLEKKIQPIYKYLDIQINKDNTQTNSIKHIHPLHTPR